MKCPTNSQPTEPPFKTIQGSKIAKQVLAHYDDLARRGGVLSAENTAEVILQREFAVMVTSAAHIPILTKYSKVENLMATVLGFKSTVIGAIDLSMTQAGATRYLLQSRAREASKLLQLAAVNKSLPKIRELYSELIQALPELSKDKIQTVLHDHIIIGQFPKLQNIYDSPVAKAQLAQRYQEHVARLIEDGIDPNAIKRLDILSGEISQSFDNARSIAGKYGLDVKILANGGYYPIQVNDSIKKLLEGASKTGRSSAASAVFDTAKILSSSRTSTMPIVLDLAKAANVLGLTELELAFKLVEPGGISSYLRKRFSTADLERMFDNGTLAQIPALSDELTVFFAEELDLPIKGIGQAMILDPVQAIKTYNSQLSKAVENSSMVQLALDEGMKSGWLVDFHSIRDLPDVKNYIKLGSDPLFKELFRSEKLRENIAELYMHRTAVDQLNALTKASSSFTSLSLIGAGLQAFLKFTGFTKRSLILATGGLPYISRVFLQNAVSLLASTGSDGMLQYGNALAEVFRTLVGKKPLPTETFAKIGDIDFSLSTLFDATFLRRGEPEVDLAGITIDKTARDKLMETFDVESRKRFFAQMEVYHQRYGSPVTGKINDRVNMVLETANNSFKLAYEQLAKTNQFLDFSARWSSVRANAKDPSLSGRTAWKDLDELLRYTDEYFNVNNDVGEVGTVANQFLVPFASFALVAPGVTLRHAIRHPWRYARMMSLYAQANASNDLTDAEIADYQKQTYPVFIGKDPETGKRWSINPGTVDSFLDTTTWAKENFEKVARGFGVPVGSAKEQIEQKIDPTTDFRNSFADIMNKTYLGKPFQVSLGIDPSTGEKLKEVGQQDTLLGVGMPSQLRALITEVIPALRSLDRALPAAIVGESTVQDPITLEVTREGRPGFLGNVPVVGGRPRDKEIVKAGVIGWIANTGGLTLSQVDPQANIIRTYRDFDGTQGELDKAISSLSFKLNSQPEGAATLKLREERLRLIQLSELLLYNKLIIDRLAISKGYTPNFALTKVRTTITNVDKVPREYLLEFIQQQQKQK